MPSETLISLYESMLRIRLVEEAIAEHYGEGEMRCPVHLSIGQEAVAVGVCEALKVSDKVYSTHRCHAHYLAKGGDLKRMIAEICGKAAGCIGGRGGSMHLIDAAKGMMASMPIVVELDPDRRRQRACRQAHAQRARSPSRSSATPRSRKACSTRAPTSPRCTRCRSSSSARTTSIRSTRRSTSASRTGRSTDVARAHGMHGRARRRQRCRARAIGWRSEAVARARAGSGPTFLLLDTYRWREHCGPSFDNHIGYRTEAEFSEWDAALSDSALCATALATRSTPRREQR